MILKIRLARRGKKGEPFYDLVLAESRSKRGAFKRKFGYYNPLLENVESKLFISDPLLLRKYLMCGAQPTDRVRILLDKMGFKAKQPEDEATPAVAN